MEQGRKSILIGFDGTGCNLQDETNVQRLLDAAIKYHPTIYIRGVGDRWGMKLAGGVNGAEFFKRLREALRWCAMAWEPGDDIYIVGYSRGGALAIAFSNLLYAVGMGPDFASNRNPVFDEAFEVFEARPGYRALRQRAFRKKHGLQRPRVRFLGCFDPVGALGAGLPQWAARARYGVFSGRPAPNVENYLSLLALDEHRRTFSPIMQDRKGTIRMDQVWVPGCHGDIGGGNDRHRPVADYTYKEMSFALLLAGLSGMPFGRYPIDDSMFITSSWRRPYSWLGRAIRMPEEPLGFPGEKRSSLAKWWSDMGRPTWSGTLGLPVFQPAPEKVIQR